MVGLFVPVESFQILFKAYSLDILTLHDFALVENIHLGDFHTHFRIMEGIE